MAAAAAIGEQLSGTYQKRRVSGGLQVSNVARSAH